MLDKSRIKEQDFTTASKHDVIERRRRSKLFSTYFFSLESPYAAQVEILPK